VALFLRPALRGLRHPLFRGHARSVLVQLADRRLRDLPRLRAGDRGGFRSGGARRVEDPGRGRGEALADRELPRVPGRPREDGEEVWCGDGHPGARPATGASPVVVRRRPEVEELGQLVAALLVWRAPLLRLAGDQGLQDAHPCAAVALPQLYGVPGLPRRALETRRPALAPADQRPYRGRGDRAGDPRTDGDAGRSHPRGGGGAAHPGRP